MTWLSALASFCAGVGVFIFVMLCIAVFGDK
jgi:hypothetical protein